MSDLNRKLVGVMQQDKMFLQQHGFLDYSLLIAIEKSEAEFDAEKSMLSKRLTRGLIRFKRRDAIRSLSDDRQLFSSGIRLQKSTESLTHQKSLHKLIQV